MYKLDIKIWWKQTVNHCLYFQVIWKVQKKYDHDLLQNTRKQTWTRQNS